MKRIIINIGSVVAILTMLSPFFIIMNFNSINNNIFWLTCSIFYDIYIYSVIEKKQKMINQKEHYYKYVKDSDKKLNLKVTYKEKFENLENYIEELLKEYFD